MNMIIMLCTCICIYTHTKGWQHEIHTVQCIGWKRQIYLLETTLQGLTVPALHNNYIKIHNIHVLVCIVLGTAPHTCNLPTLLSIQQYTYTMYVAAHTYMYVLINM